MIKLVRYYRKVVGFLEILLFRCYTGLSRVNSLMHPPWRQTKTQHFHIIVHFSPPTNWMAHTHVTWIPGEIHRSTASHWQTLFMIFLNSYVEVYSWQQIWIYFIFISFSINKNTDLKENRSATCQICCLPLLFYCFRRKHRYQSRSH